MPPFIRGVAEHFLPAGPILGVLSALYSSHLASSGSALCNPATHEVVRQTQSWHGHVLRSYYITPGQHALWWALSLPAALWLVSLVLGVTILGVRSHYQSRKTFRDR